MLPGLLNNLKKGAHIGRLKRIHCQNPDNFPAISPNVQGSKALKLLTPEQRGQLKVALHDAAKYYKCTVRDLQWRFGVGGAIHIRKIPRVELRAG